MRHDLLITWWPGVDVDTVCPRRCLAAWLEDKGLTMDSSYSAHFTCTLAELRQCASTLLHELEKCERGGRAVGIYKTQAAIGGKLRSQPAKWGDRGAVEAFLRSSHILKHPPVRWWMPWWGRGLEQRHLDTFQGLWPQQWRHWSEITLEVHFT